MKLLLVCLTMLAFPALAADKPGADPTKRLQQQLRKSEQEKAQLVQQKTEAESQVKDAQGKADEAQKRADAAAGRNSKLSKELAAAKAEIGALTASSKAEQAALTGKLAESQRTLAELRLAFGAEKQQLEAVLAKHKTALSGCWERNDRMYKLGYELLDKYEQKSCFTSALQAEPFTGLKRAQIENMVEEDKEKFDKEQILPGK
jgi:chromosome segregation ATPase